MSTKTTLLLLLSVMTVGNYACSREDVVKPTENVIAVHQPGDSEMSCAELDKEIGLLYQMAAEMAPKKFAADPLNQGAMAIGTFVFTPAYLYALRNELIDKPRQYERINAIIKRIEVLQRYKAEKHCFERR
jgi:hypothetical protein